MNSPKSSAICRMDILVVSRPSESEGQRGEVTSKHSRSRAEPRSTSAIYTRVSLLELTHAI
jgi:hypothetical protein